MKVLIPLLVLVAAVVGLIITLRRSGSAMKPKDGFVDVYDFQAKKVSTIPAAELAPGMVRIPIDGKIFWAKASELKQGTVVHPAFDGKLRDLVIQIQKSLEEVYPHNYEFWEDGFRRDVNAEREIALWLHISRIYRGFVEDISTTFEERKEAFQVLVACSNGTEETALQTVKLTALDRADALVLISKFYKGEQNGKSEK